MHGQIRSAREFRNHFADTGFLYSDLVGRVGCGQRLGGRSELGQQGVEFDLAQEIRDRLIVDSRPDEVFRRNFKRYISFDPYQFAGQFNLSAMFEDEACDLFRSAYFSFFDSIETGEKRFGRAEMADESAGGLLTDAGDALDVVDRVAHQGHDVDQRTRFDPKAIAYFARPRTAVTHGVPQRDVRTDELHEVLVAGDDDDVELVACPAYRQRADDVVGLVAVDDDAVDAEGANRAMDVRDLHLQIGGRLDAIGLVVLEEVVAKGL